MMMVVVVVVVMVMMMMMMMLIVVVMVVVGLMSIIRITRSILLFFNSVGVSWMTLVSTRHAMK